MLLQSLYEWQHYREFMAVLTSTTLNYEGYYPLDIIAVYPRYFIIVILYVVKKTYHAHCGNVPFRGWNIWF